VTSALVNNTSGFRVPSALVNITYIPTGCKKGSKKAIYAAKKERKKVFYSNITSQKYF
jgi:hypothetical protein